MLARSFVVGNIDALACMRCNVDHFLEGWVVESLYWLHFEVGTFEADHEKLKRQLPDQFQ